jgi:Pyruvate/2-oxoacid:ferredoxin oxidoreductase delta subunit
MIHRSPSARRTDDESAPALAAYNGLLEKWYGDLKIQSNDHCISCTQCSKYCHVGVDVMAFAKNTE